MASSFKNIVMTDSPNNDCNMEYDQTGGNTGMYECTTEFICSALCEALRIGLEEKLTENQFSRLRIHACF